MADLRASRPAYFIDASQDPNFAKGRYPVTWHPPMAEWLEANYVLDFEQVGEGGRKLVVYRRRDHRPASSVR
jgi:hypothetical protein